MGILVHTLWSAMELAYMWLFFSPFFEPRLRKREHILWFLAAVWAAMTVCGALEMDPVSPLLMRLLAMVVMLLFVFGESGRRGLLLIAFAAALSLIVETAALYAAGALLGMDMPALLSADAACFTAMTAGKALSLFSAWLLGRYKNGGPQNSRWMYLTMLLPTVLLFAVVIIFSVRDEQGGGTYLMGGVLVCGALLLANLAIHFAIRAMEQSSAQELDMLLQRQHMEMQTESINALEQNYRQQRKNTHEFEHHLQVLQDLLDQGETAQAREYIDRLQGNRPYRAISVNSGHTVIDVILNQKYQTARENGINIQIRVNDLSGVTLPTDSLVVILSNLLDNAIEACRRLDGYREIDCSVLYDEGLYIAIQNTSEPVTVVDGRIATSKPDKAGHGFGLDGVCRLLDRLNAEYTFGYEDGWFQYAAEILN